MTRRVRKQTYRELAVTPRECCWLVKGEVSIAMLWAHRTLSTRVLRPTVLPTGPSGTMREPGPRLAASGEAHGSKALRSETVLSSLSRYPRPTAAVRGGWGGL
jgi:hypothetical protein